MAHLWTTNAEGDWALLPLAGECRLAAAAEHGVCLAPPTGAPGRTEVRLVPPNPAGGLLSWTLLGGRDAPLRVNGQLLALGVRALRDRDEVSIAGERCFFSTEELARVAAFPGLAQAAFCPRCKQVIEPGSLAVACPNCGAWHHQSEKYPCWTYDAVCAMCRIQPTALGADYSWTPEML